MKRRLFLLFVSALIVACTKIEGVGGKTTITGVVEAIFVQKGSFDTISIEPSPEHRVYIVYGEGTISDDNIRTNSAGKYKFDYLNPGNYKIYTFSESLLNNSGLREVSVKVKISKGETDVSAPKMTIIQYVK